MASLLHPSPTLLRSLLQYGMARFVASMRAAGKTEDEIADGIEWVKATCHKKHENPPKDTRHPIRAFDPSWNDLYKGQISDLLVVCECCEGYYLRVTTLDNIRDRDHGAPVVFIAGACREIGESDVRASIGVFYGPDCAHNFSYVMEKSDHADTKQRAEVQAAIAGIEQAYMDPEGKHHPCKILIMTDSKDLVDSMSNWIWKWKENGYRNKSGKPLANKEKFRELEKLVGEKNKDGTDVWFWHIRKEHNQDAYRLANEALDSE